MVQDAWERAQPLSICGVIYRVSDGILRDLELCVTGAEELEPLCR